MPGFITVRVGKLPGQINDYSLNGGRYVRDALSAAGLSSAGYQIRVNDRNASLDTYLEDGDIVLLTKTVTGN